MFDIEAANEEEEEECETNEGGGARLGILPSSEVGLLNGEVSSRGGRGGATRVDSVACFIGIVFGVISGKGRLANLERGGGG